MLVLIMNEVETNNILHQKRKPITVNDIFLAVRSHINLRSKKSVILQELHQV